MIDHQTGQVMDVQHQGLDQLDSFPALKSWRDLMVGILTKVHCAGGCPLGSLASDLALAMLAAVRGGLLLSQVRRDPKPLVTAVDTMIAHLRHWPPEVSRRGRRSRGSSPAACARDDR